MNPQKGESILKDDNKLDEKTQESFDIKEAAKFLGVSVRTLKRWRKSGKLVPDTISQRFLQVFKESTSNLSLPLTTSITVYLSLY